LTLANLTSLDEELHQILKESKGIDLPKEEISQIRNKEELIEYLVENPDNVEFEYVIKFYGYSQGIDGFQAYDHLIKNNSLKDLDYKIILYPEWHLKDA